MLVNKLKIEKVMEEHEMDALVATTPENVAYLTGFWTLTSLRHRARQNYAVVFRKEMTPDMIISRGLVDHPLQMHPWVAEVLSLRAVLFCTGRRQRAGRRIQKFIPDLGKPSQS